MTTQTDRLNTALAGRYCIERHLGEGGMASVYLAEDVKTRSQSRAQAAQAGAPWDVAADGRFIMARLRRTQSAPSTVVVAENWLTELKSRMKR